MAGRPKKNPVVEPEKEVEQPLIVEPEQKEPEKTIEETPKVNEVEEIKQPDPEPEKPEEKPVDKIMEKYLEKCVEESDINLLLPKIFEIASSCDHCTEFGVRKPTSTYALLAAKPKRVVSYDIGRLDFVVDEVEQLCADAGQDFQFFTQNVLDADIEQTDMILVDSYHSFAQATAELARHAHKVNKYILFHDTAEYAYGWKCQPWYPGVADFMNCPEGLYPAIENFLRDNPNWTLFYETDINNGLTTLKKNN